MYNIQGNHKSLSQLTHQLICVLFVLAVSFAVHLPEEEQGALLGNADLGTCI